MAMNQLEVILRPNSRMNVNKKLAELRKSDPIFSSLVTSIFLEDARTKKGIIFRIKTPIKSRSEVPTFRFL